MTITYYDRVVGRGVWKRSDGKIFLAESPVQVGTNWEYKLIPLSKYKVLRMFQVVYHRILGKA